MRVGSEHVSNDFRLSVPNTLVYDNKAPHGFDQFDILPWIGKRVSGVSVVANMIHDHFCNHVPVLKMVRNVADT